MLLRITFIIVSLVLIACANGGADQKMWDLKALSKPPATYPASICEPVGEKAYGFEGELKTPEAREKAIKECEVRSLLYDGMPYKGKPTRVFAFYGKPKAPAGTKFPAMVLVHGGGGTAFESWVRLWNTRGYAAIAMDTCGCVPEGAYREWKRLDDGGPPGWGGFDQMDEPVQDQWPYHAVSDVILAHSLLRSFPEVDSDRIGITGISWGGYLTCISAGVDKRFKFAAPVYGCGFLGENSAWLPMFKRMGKAKADLWLKQWDPSNYLPGAKLPMLWVTGTNDFAYPMDSLQKSYRLPIEPHTLCLRVRMGHGHGGVGECPEEIRAFADSICKVSMPLAKTTAQGCDANQVWATFSSKSKVTKAELNFTKDTGIWPERKWETVPATISGDRVSATLPAGARVYYLNLIDDRGLIVSTEHVEIADI